MPAFVDLTGQVFGRWTVLSRSESSKQGNSRWLCRCKCGTERILIGSMVSHAGKRRYASSSCGCLNREKARERATKHGHGTKGSESPTYHTWVGMMNRC